MALVKPQLDKSQYNRWQIHNLSQDSKLIVAFKLIKQLKEKIFNILNYFLKLFSAFGLRAKHHYELLSTPRTMLACCSVLTTLQKKNRNLIL